MVCRRPEEVVNAVQARSLGARSGTLVGIDGARGAGKTVLAHGLGQSLCAPVVSLDKFLKDDGESYVARLDLGRVRSVVRDHLRLSGVVAVEGICLLDALERLEIGVHHHVYVRRISAGGRFCDDELFDDEIELDEGIHAKLSMQNCSSAGEWLDAQIQEYHHRVRPHVRADTVFERVE
jgi:hypothetical protein